MNYERVRSKLKEKNEALRSLSGSDRDKAEKSIIESESVQEKEKDPELNLDQSEPENPVQEKSYKGKKRGPKRRK